MGYEKDIFRNFAYDFELSHKNEILASARTKSANADEIFGYASDEIKSTHSPSSRISHAAGVFHIAKRYFTHPKGWIKLKTTDSIGICRFLHKGYEKDIFTVFAYEFELSQFLVKYRLTPK